MKWGHITEQALEAGYVDPDEYVLMIFQREGSVNKTAKALGAARQSITRYLERAGLSWNGKQWIEVETNE